MTLDHSRQLTVHGNYVRPKNELRAGPAVHDGSDSDSSQMGQGGHSYLSDSDNHGRDAGGYVGTIITLGAGLPDQEEDAAIMPS